MNRTERRLAKLEASRKTASNGFQIRFLPDPPRELVGVAEQEVWLRAQEREEELKAQSQGERVMWVGFVRSPNASSAVDPRLH